MLKFETIKLEGLDSLQNTISPVGYLEYCVVYNFQYPRTYLTIEKTIKDIKDGVIFKDQNDENNYDVSLYSLYRDTDLWNRIDKVLACITTNVFRALPISATDIAYHDTVDKENSLFTFKYRIPDVE